jgi:EmrB/QacA subfamily drug resistance transporter
VGRKRMFLVGTVVFLTASAAAGLAGSVEVLVASRVLQAAGGAILVPTSLALILPEFPLSQRATAIAIWTATGAIAAATGPSLGGLLIDSGGWRWAFFVNLPIGLLALIPASRLLRESRDPEARTLPDALGTVVLAAGVGLLALGIVQGPDWGWAGARVLASIVAGVLLVGLAIGRSLRHPAPVIEPGLFRIRSFAVANAGMLAFSFAFYAIILANVLFLTGVWGWSVLTAGFAITPAPLTAALTAPIGGRLVGRVGFRPVALVGGLLVAAAAGWYALFLDITPDYAGEYLPATILSGAGVGLSFAAWGSASLSELPAPRFATGSALVSTLRQFGAVLGIAVLIAVLETGSPADPVGAFTTAYTILAGAALLAGLISFGLAGSRPAAATTPLPAPAPALPDAEAA